MDILLLILILVAVVAIWGVLLRDLVRDPVGPDRTPRSHVADEPEGRATVLTRLS